MFRFAQDSEALDTANQKPGPTARSSSISLWKASLAKQLAIHDPSKKLPRSVFALSGAASVGYLTFHRKQNPSRGFGFSKVLQQADMCDQGTLGVVDVWGFSWRCPGGVLEMFDQDLQLGVVLEGLEMSWT
ncbi:unnamed protein product [Sphagnum jensenii]|uniref:Uncharacterized protein n=1 Tax=Sphagnum jensenii TaxID=128206 RepID=A0ABP1A953_9BRYO